MFGYLLVIILFCVGSFCIRSSLRRKKEEERLKVEWRQRQLEKEKILHEKELSAKRRLKEFITDDEFRKIQEYFQLQPYGNVFNTLTTFEDPHLVATCHFLQEIARFEFLIEEPFRQEDDGVYYHHFGWTPILFTGSCLESCPLIDYLSMAKLKICREGKTIKMTCFTPQCKELYRNENNRARERQEALRKIKDSFDT